MSYSNNETAKSTPKDKTMENLKQTLESTTDNFIHSDFFLPDTDKPYYEIEMEVQKLLLQYYHSATVTVADYDYKTCVWYTAQGRI